MKSIEKNHQSYDSPEKRTESRSIYNLEKHEINGILNCIAKAIYSSEEKLSFTVLKLLDMFLEKNVPEVLDNLFLKSISI
jgi:hypothetical protein